ncbi:MAG: hypothetical protein QNM02_21660 [Acidimicrobiia bacterium]|nr:hypothetical protein [Acidimicrobiia bacterium]
MHPLHEALIAAADGDFPTVDGAVEVLPPDAAGTWAVFEFTGHSFVLADREPTELSARGADGFGGASQPDLLRWLAGPGGVIGSHDAVLVARGTGCGSDVLVERSDLSDHPRVLRSRHHRSDVRVFADDVGLVTLGSGLVGRLELSVELLSAEKYGAGAGTRLISDGLAEVPAGELVWAQVAPGNAASLRSFLRAGFVPIGAETLIDTTRD